jgi:hypothetical protein
VPESVGNEMNEFFKFVLAENPPSLSQIKPVPLPLREIYCYLQYRTVHTFACQKQGILALRKDPEIISALLVSK